MKKVISFVGILFLILSQAVIFAQMPVTAPLGIPANAAQIGVVAAAKGNVELKMPGQVGRIAQSGQSVFMGDEVKTDAQGNLQILFLDETVFTIGPNSTLVIDEFIYDPKTQEGKVQASIAKGVFRYVSGKIAAKKPSNVTLKLPTATIGIRGTIVGGHVVPGGNSLAALLGPGTNNNAGMPSGSFTISGSGPNSGSQNVNRTGFGVTVGSGGTLSGVFQLSPLDIQNLTTGLSPSGGGSNSQGNGGSATDGSGQGNVNTGVNGDVSNFLSSLTALLNDDVKAETIENSGASGAVADGLSTIQDLATIPVGVYHYAFSGVFVQSTPSVSIGTVSGSIDLHGGSNGSIGGGNSKIDIYTPGYISASRSLGEQPFTSGAGGYAMFNYVRDNSNISAVVMLQNLSGVAGQNAVVSVNYDDGDGTTGTGSATGDRVSGATSGGGPAA
ncbi:MAG TPA: FecR domain-containing protein [Candidatus Omnitrophota bacterium]|nr:FecR domain-containing protein [Candidatus Omnitrophota bacterium]